MALTSGGRGALVGALVLGGFLTWAGAMVAWDDPPLTPKRQEYVVATQVAGVLILCGLFLTGLPVVSGPGSQRRRQPEPDPGPAPVAPRWHRVALLQKHPAVVFRTPNPCPTCGDHEVGWTVSIAERERKSGAAKLLNAAGLGVVVALADLAKKDDDGGVSVNVCDPCFQLDAARRTSRVLLTAVWFSPSLVAILSALVLSKERLAPTLAVVAPVGVAALLLHLYRFRRRRARETALVGQLGVRARLTHASWFAVSEGALRWTLTVDACDPTWALALIAKNIDGCDVRADMATLEAHAAELRAAELR
jgi:hypothetical protein